MLRGNIIGITHVTQLGRAWPTRIPALFIREIDVGLPRVPAVRGRWPVIARFVGAALLALTAPPRPPGARCLVGVGHHEALSSEKQNVGRTDRDDEQDRGDRQATLRSCFVDNGLSNVGRDDLSLRAGVGGTGEGLCTVERGLGSLRGAIRGVMLVEEATECRLR
jgi:hypothetical protein